MSNKLMKFNPGFKSDEDILAEFVVRQADLDLVLTVLRENVSAPANQHLLLIGPRGIGKTTLVLRAKAEITQQDDALRAQWYPIVFSEESYPVSTPGEFWLEALFHAAEQRNDDALRSVYQELRDEPVEERLRERALARLLDLADEEGKRLLLIVENLQMLLGDQLSDNDAWILRHTFTNEPRIMLLGTATTRFWEMTDTDQAFYEAFKVLDLKPLNTAECQQLWEAVSGQPVTVQRVRPVQILTGGNPRLLAVIATFAAHSSLRQLMDNLTRLVDDHTDYFKSHLDELPPMERKVFVALCDLWDPATAREVARAARADVNKASAQLQRLEKRGAVVAEQHGRKKLYRVAERLYNIYYLMRRRSEPSARVRALVRFMVSFYEADKLLRVAGVIAREAVWLGKQESQDHVYWAEELLHSVSAQSESQLRNIMIGAMEGEIEGTVADADAAWKEALKERDPEHIREAETKLRRIMATWPDVPESSLRLAYMLAEAGNAEQRKDAVAIYEKIATMPLASEWAVVLRSVLACELGRDDEAEQDVRRLLAAAPKLMEEWPDFEQVQHGLAGRVMMSLDCSARAAAFAELYLHSTGRSATSLNNAAWAAHSRWGEPFASQAEAWACEAHEKSPSDGAIAHTLAAILASRGGWLEALELVPKMLADGNAVEKCTAEYTDLLIDFAAVGHTEKALNLLECSPSAAAFEPLLFALRLDAGEKASVAPEILEVAQDIVTKIRERRAALQKGKHGSTAPA